MTEAEILNAIEGLEPALQRAYLDKVRAVTDAAVVAEIERYIDARDEDAIVEALSLGLLALFLEQVRAAYIAGATLEIRQLPRAVGAEFDSLGTEPASWLAQNAGAIQRESAEATRLAVRHTIQTADLLGQSARRTALDLVGRRSAQTGERTGGVVGLPGNYAQFVANARVQLLSGDPVQMRQYLTRLKRDRRFDRTVQKAIEAGRPVAQADVDRITGRYAERLLLMHAQTLGETQAHSAFHAGRDQVFEQLVGEGIERHRIIKEWHTVRDERVRHSHAAMQGQKQQLGSPFVSGAGAQLMYPGDDSLGAGDAEIIHCRCWAEYTIGGPRAR